MGIGWYGKTCRRKNIFRLCIGKRASEPPSMPEYVVFWKYLDWRVMICVWFLVILIIVNYHYHHHHHHNYIFYHSYLVYLTSKPCSPKKRTDLLELGWGYLGNARKKTFCLSWTCFMNYLGGPVAFCTGHTSIHQIRIQAPLPQVSTSTGPSRASWLCLAAPCQNHMCWCISLCLNFTMPELVQHYAAQREHWPHDKLDGDVF